MPDRTMVDRLVQQYFTTFETTYRILHAPLFWSSYSKFLDESSESSNEVGAVILAVLACTICTSPEQSQQHPTASTFRTRAITWIKACQFWLRRHSNRRRSLESLQVRCLLILAYMTTCLKTKEIYQEVQSHVAFMKASGMHRDPAILGSKCTTFEAEIRRRLWATTMEFEIQASIDRGTSSSLSSLEYDCAPPQNIDDSYLQPDNHSLPPSQPLSTYTDTSFLHLAMQSLPLRVTLCTLSNQIKNRLDFQEILHYEHEIMEALKQLPKWTDSRALQAATHLDLQLRQFILILHSTEAFRTQSKPSTKYSRFATVEASLTLIQKHMDLIESRNFALCCIRSDYYRAAITLCHIGYHYDSFSGQSLLLYSVLN